VGVTGFFDASGQHLTSVGIQCAICHSTVNDSLLPGIGSRLDGWANHDLNIGEIALAPKPSACRRLAGSERRYRASGVTQLGTRKVRRRTLP
jgi:hypothetical protein